jgi:N-acylneuraminate cytidylyltransferase/CMP-N,N'-diacetyllegionaminic acid synthase
VALDSGLFSDVLVSTDSVEIAEVAEGFGASVPFLRPKALAGDNSTSADVMMHLLGRVPLAQKFALLQPTSPLREVHHLSGAMDLIDSSQAESLVSIMLKRYPVSHLLPCSGLENIGNPSGYDVTFNGIKQSALRLLNGAIYLSTTERFQRTGTFFDSETVFFEMDQMSSVDIDDEDDWMLAEAVLSARK